MNYNFFFREVLTYADTFSPTSVFNPIPIANEIRKYDIKVKMIQIVFFTEISISINELLPPSVIP